MYSIDTILFPNLSNLVHTGARCKNPQPKRKTPGDDIEIPNLEFIVQAPLQDMSDLLNVSKSTISGGGQGLFAIQNIKKGSVFAEYYGPVGVYNSSNVTYAVRLTETATPFNDAAKQYVKDHLNGRIDTVYGDSINCLAAKANTAISPTGNNAMIVSASDRHIVNAVKASNNSNNNYDWVLEKRRATKVGDGGNNFEFECERLFLVAIDDILADGEVFNYYNRDADV
jgi:hypothetical protein